MDLLYKNANDSTYAASIASTWIWAPALFVSSSMAYLNGLFGFLWFFIPNVLTLILFGYLTQKYVPTEGFTVGSLFDDMKAQQKLHDIVSVILLVCSTTVQFIALDMIVCMFITANIYISTIIVGLLCFAYIYYGGIKLCIQSDAWKYLILATSGIFLVAVMLFNNALPSSEIICGINWFGINDPNFISISLSFGIITAIGLLSAPYVDNTFWQRAYSMNKDRRYRIHLKSAWMFGLIPFMFGFLGFIATATSTDPTWNITKMFEGNLLLQVVFLIAAFSTLIATIDSNMCALNSLTYKEFNLKNDKLPIPILMIGLPMLIIFIFHPSIVDMFLVYGTIRTAIAIPTVLKMFDRYSRNRLFIGTLLAVLIGGIGYIYCAITGNGYGWCFTVFALLFPLVGYKRAIS